MTDEQKQIVREIIREEMEGTFAHIFSKHIQLLDGRKIQVGKGVGTEIATESDQKLAFFGATPVVRQAAIADFSNGNYVGTDTINRDQVATDIGNIITKSNLILARLRTFGLITT